MCVGVPGCEPGLGDRVIRGTERCPGVAQDRVTPQAFRAATRSSDRAYAHAGVEVPPMNVIQDSVIQGSRLRRMRRLAVGGVALVAGFVSVAVWSAADPEATLRLRVLTALTADEVWAVGTDVRVVGTEVRVQGFVRSEADRARVLAVAAGISGVERVRDRLSLTAWPARVPVEPGPIRKGTQVASLPGPGD